MVQTPQRLKSWTVNEYHQMLEAGIFSSDSCVELLDGQIIEMVPQDPPHASTIDEGSDYLKALFAGLAKVRVQLPITITPDSEPEPDFAVVRIDPNRYRDRHPYPDDIFLIIEVSASTLTYDRTQKAKTYAKADIPEYWILNLKQRTVIVFRQPQNGRYQSEQVLSLPSRISCLAFPEISVDCDRLLS